MLTSPLARAALELRASRTSRAAEVLAGVGALFRFRVRLELDLALLLAWIKRSDVAELGYSSFSSFRCERVDWCTSWLRDLIRLVESPLDLVKRAVAEGAIPLSVAIRAPGHVEVADQAAWLLHATPPAPVPGQARVEVDGDDAVAVREARKLARICLGRARTAREVDDHVVACWRDRVPVDEILDRAHERPERPEPAPLSWEWREEPAPESLGEAMSRLDGLQLALRGLTPTVARAWALLVDDGAWAEAYDSVEDCALDVLGLSLRHSQRLAKLGRTLLSYPDIDRAVREGLSLAAADQLGRHWPSDGTVQRWVALAQGVGAIELRRALADARWGPRKILAAHATLARISATTSPGARVVVVREEVPVTREPLRCVPELVPASHWWVETVRWPAPRGFAAVKARDGWRCLNPECGRVSLRNEAHHVVFRSRGGVDCPDTNGLTLCRPCHLRLVHAGRLTVERLEVGGDVVLRWTWADGRRVIGWAPRARPTADP